MIPRYSRPEMVAIWSPRDQVPHLVRDRGACLRRAGRARRHPEGGRQDDLGKGQRRHLRRRAHRRDRARDQARRHRLPDPSGRDRRAGRALRAPGHDLVRRARHLPHRAAGARLRHPACRSRRAACGAEAARLRAQGHADHRPQPRHPCRADHFRRSSWRRPMPSSRAAARAWSLPARRSPPARSRARSAPSPTSTRASRSMSPPSSA